MKLSDIAELNPKRTLKKGTVAPFVEMAALPTNAKNITEITQKTFSGSGSKFKNGDTLFARITPCLENGKTALITELNDEEIAHGSTEFIVISPKNISVDMHYIYYLARLPEFREYARSRMEGTSGRQRVSWQSLAEFEFNFPNEEKRKVIGEKLSLLDEKITLNTQTNQTLEQIAQAIFKHWFIDFAPVHAKANALARGETIEQAELAAMACLSGKTAEKITALKTQDPTTYHQLQQTAAAFPSEFVETEMGQVPRGWEVKQVKDMGKIICGKTPSKKKEEFYGNDIPFIKIPDMHNNTFIIKTTDNLSLLGANNQKNKFIEKGSICISCIATVGLVSITSERSQTNQQINSIVPNSEIFTEYLYLYFSQDTMNKKLKDLASGGSATLNLNTTAFSNITLLIPNNNLIEFFHKKVQPLFDKILSNKKESISLSDARDELLPKLLRGEIEL
ncbi:hypothetical protein IO46_02940 [Gallibacterium anatis]|uniref:restriction endonuclease subunit S n=1 Tax=Gallibacterium anatis TaxID=750 RepID=UPI000531E14E|nr:restriction endonuclease subunit S [Gallibacterium anatis]KGQ53428.1 hypothetical protein IO46_02940 [Gallibacterium anatis]KGQ61061.1 hypothetical protein IO45_01515 [Gallibacterium anatis]